MRLRIVYMLLEWMYRPPLQSILIDLECGRQMQSFRTQHDSVCINQKYLNRESFYCPILRRNFQQTSRKAVTNIYFFSEVSTALFFLIIEVVNIPIWTFKENFPSNFLYINLSSAPYNSTVAIKKNQMLYLFNKL